MSYCRVIPRDLFNESKLLKCLGQFALLVHEGRGIRWSIGIEHDDSDNQGFTIEQNLNDGSLFCSNMTFSVNGRLFNLFSRYNSKAAYPLMFGGDSEPEGDVFDDDGSFSDEFCAFLDQTAVL